MDVNEYQTKALRTNIYPPELALYALALGLSSEAGEVASLVKRVARDFGGSLTLDARQRLRYELGDVLWYVAVLAAEAGFTMSEVAEGNIEKLKDRLERDKIKGEGDKR